MLNAQKGTSILNGGAINRKPEVVPGKELNFRLGLEADLPLGDLDGVLHRVAAILTAKLLCLLLDEVLEAAEARIRWAARLLSSLRHCFKECLDGFFFLGRIRTGD